MAALPVFARYIKTGDTITHPHGFRGKVTEIRKTDKLVSGWMRNPAKPGHVQGFSYPTDALVSVLTKESN